MKRGLQMTDRKVGLWELMELMNGKVIDELNYYFKIPPIPYGHKKRNEFIKSMHNELKHLSFMFVGEVELKIFLYLDEQQRDETDKLADLDNYAKAICKGLIGPDGILIDSSQIQNLFVSWIDTTRSPYFELYVRPLPFINVINKPISFYKMPDGLYYPIPSVHEDIGSLITIMSSVIENKDELLSRYFKGYPENRIISNGFNIKGGI